MQSTLERLNRFIFGEIQITTNFAFVIHLNNKKKMTNHLFYIEHICSKVSFNID